MNKGMVFNFKSHVIHYPQLINSKKKKKIDPQIYSGTDPTNQQYPH